MRRARWPAAARDPKVTTRSASMALPGQNRRKIVALPRGPSTGKVKEIQIPRGLTMKRKGHPNIPDFSPKRALPQPPEGHVPKPKQPALPTVHGGKPHSTNKKS